MSDTQFGPWAPGVQSRTQFSSQKCFRPFNLKPTRNGQIARSNSFLHTPKAGPPLTPLQLPKDIPSGTSSNTRPPTLQIPGSQVNRAIGTLSRVTFRVDSTPSSPISALRPRATSAPQKVAGQDQSPHSIFSLSPFPRTTSQPAFATVSPHQPAEKHYELKLDSITHNGHPLRAQKTVELYDGTFLRIASIKNQISDGRDDQIFLQGPKFQRTRDLMGLFSLNKGEVAMYSLSEKIPLSEVLRPRILILTNAAFPKYREVIRDGDIAEREGRLVCRWRTRMVSKQEGYIWRLQQHEVDKKYRMDDSKLRKTWRGGLVEAVKMLQDETLQDSLPRPRGDLFEQEGFVEWSVRKKNFVDLTAEKPKQKEDTKETHHTAIVTNDGSLKLKQTSYAPFQRGNSSGAGGLGSSRYEATIDSRTPAGRFLGYFQGTYTPNPNASPNSCYSSLRPNRIDNLGSLTPPSLQNVNKFSGTLPLRTPVATAGNPNIWSSNKKQLGVFDNSGLSPTDAQPTKPAYQISARPLTYPGGNFRPSKFLGSTVTPKGIFWSDVYNNLKDCSSSSKSLGPFNSQLPTTTIHGTLSVKSKQLPISQDIILSEGPSKSSLGRCDSLQGFSSFLKPSPSSQQAFNPGFSPSARRKYKFGDAFCGGGGMSSGARSAGFTNAWSFDFNIDAVATYRKNFPGCKTYHTSVNEFVALPPEDLLVDVVHLSPPCQPHSPAHTIAGKDDDRNEASLFCVEECLGVSRPRMVTLEQTDGILNRPEWFRTLVRSFTDLGFSVSWKVLHGVEYGVPQTRKRLFLLAARSAITQSTLRHKGTNLP